MKQNVFAVLMYLFENYMDEDNPIHSDPEAIKHQLKSAGFQGSHITKAFTWLEELVRMQDEDADLVPNIENGIRVYNQIEQEKLNVDCQGFLHFLEKMGVIDPISREHIIDRVMALESDDIEITQLKWVVLMVLFNQSGVDEAYTWMENMVLENLSQDFH